MADRLSTLGHGWVTASRTRPTALRDPLATAAGRATERPWEGENEAGRPHRVRRPNTDLFTGTVSLFEKAGFEKTRDAGQRVVMVKKL